MPRYYFHLEDSVFIEDCEGSELPDDAAAVRQANLLALRLADHVKFGDWYILVDNEAGTRIATIGTDADSSLPSSAIH